MLGFGLGYARLGAQSLCSSSLPDWLLPSEANYHALQDATKRQDIYDQLHYVPLGAEGSNRYLSIGGQERQWYESFSTPPFGNGPDDPNGYLLQRYMLHFDLHLSSRIRFFVDFKAGLENGRVGGPRPDRRRQSGLCGHYVVADEKPHSDPARWPPGDGVRLRAACQYARRAKCSAPFRRSQAQLLCPGLAVGCVCNAAGSELSGSVR